MTNEPKTKSVPMMVRCLGVECLYCPQLNIDIDKYELCSNDHSGVMNILSCTNVLRCLQIKKHLRKNSNSDNEKDGV